MYTRPYFLSEFSSPKAIRDPDAAAYENQKRVRIIAQDVAPFSGAVDVPGANMFERNRLGVAAADTSFKPYLTRFPGHTLPAPGNAGKSVFLGDTEVKRFLALANQGGLPVLAPEQRAKTQPLPKCAFWPWDLPEPVLEVLEPVVLKTDKVLGNPERLLPHLHENFVRSYRRGGVVALLAAVRFAWGDRASLSSCSDWVKQASSSLDAILTFPEFAFEFEALASYREHASALGIHSRGIYGGMWVEVGELPLGAIRATELIETARLLQELVNIHTKGFAPVVVNEYHCNTDGSHRHTAAWLWNLLASCSGSSYSLEDKAFHAQVAQFVRTNEHQMGPVIVRESLRALGEMLANAEQNAKLKSEVVAHLSHFQPVTHLPVTLLLEYSAGTVVKKSYDLGTAVERVDPETYRLLASNRHYTLPARGPYHKTDRALLPWFQILKPR